MFKTLHMLFINSLGILPAPEHHFPRSAQLGHSGEVVFEIGLRNIRIDDRCHSSLLHCSRPSTTDAKCSLIHIQRPGIPVIGPNEWYCAIQISSMTENDIGVYQVCPVDLSLGHCHLSRSIEINFAACKYFRKIERKV